MNYKSLYQKVHLRLDNQDGRALLATLEAVNNAHKIIARVQDFDELRVLDTTHAVTVASKKTYHIVTDWGLTRPKDIFSIKYMDDSSSRRLRYVSPNDYDTVIPYPEQVGTQKPAWYMRRGLNIDLFPIPDEAKSLYIDYQQWPATLTSDTDVSDFPDDIEDVIVALAADIANAIMEGDVVTNWLPRAQQLLSGAVIEEAYKPDQLQVAKGFYPSEDVWPVGEYWKRWDVKENP